MHFESPDFQIASRILGSLSGARTRHGAGATQGCAPTRYVCLLVRRKVADPGVLAMLGRARSGKDVKAGSGDAKYAGGRLRTRNGYLFRASQEHEITLTPSARASFQWQEVLGVGRVTGTQSPCRTRGKWDSSAGASTRAHPFRARRITCTVIAVH